MPDARSPAPPTQFTSETAREAGKRSAEARAERRRLLEEDPDALIRLEFQSERAALSKELLDAAFGRGSFAAEVECDGCGAHVSVPGLPPEKRLGAVTKALEYAVGRPTARKDEPASKREEAPGLTIE